MFSQDFCLDLFEPSGHGKKRKRAAIEANVEASSEFLPRVERLIKRYNDSTPYTKFKENIEYTVTMPEGKYTPHRLFVTIIRFYVIYIVIIKFEYI